MLVKLVSKKGWRSCGYRTGLAEGCECVLEFDGTYGFAGDNINLSFGVELNGGEDEQGMIVYSDQIPGYGYAKLDERGWNGHSPSEVPEGKTLLGWLRQAKEGDSNKIDLGWRF